MSDASSRADVSVNRANVRDASVHAQDERVPDLLHILGPGAALVLDGEGRAADVLPWPEDGAPGDAVLP